MSHITTDYATRIRRLGFRLTPQREMILDVICEAGGHVTPEFIYARVQAKSPAVNRATVYRNLDFLCDMRLIVAAHIGRHTVYEIASPEPHHHLVCRQCGTETALPHEVVQAFFQQIDQELNFAVDMEHLTLFGLCPTCRQSEPVRRARAPRRSL